MNSFALEPGSMQSLSLGLWTHKTIPLIEPAAQHEKSTPETCCKPCFCYRMFLLVVFFRLLNFKVWMTVVNCVNNIPTTIDGIRMTHFIGSHYVEQRSSCKPTIVIPGVFFFFPDAAIICWQSIEARCWKSTMLHSIHHFEYKSYTVWTYHKYQAWRGKPHQN